MDVLPDRAAVVIVGGGFAGAATAWWLARRGVTDVVVVEREPRPGVHASGRNAGMCRVVAEDAVWTALCARGAAFLRHPPPGFGARPVLAATGSFLLASDDETLAALAARARAVGAAHERVAPAAVAARVPAAAGLPCAGALWCREDGIIDNAALLDAFLDGARRAGARVVLGAGVDAIRPAGAGAEVVTARGVVRAGVVAVAAGAWAGQVGDLAGARDVDFAAVRRHVFVLADAPVGPAAGDPFVWHVGPEEVYVRHGVGGLLASPCDGVRTPPGDARLDGGEAAAALAARLAPAPALAGRAITGAWACQRTFAPEAHPRVRRDADVPWLYWIAGLGGHGATSAAAIGEDAAAGIAAIVAAAPGGGPGA